MTCTCANAGATMPPRDSTPARLIFIGDDARIARQLRLVGHTVFHWRTSVHDGSPTDAVRQRFAPDAVVTDLQLDDTTDLPVIRVQAPTLCPHCTDLAHQPALAQHVVTALAAVTTRSGHPQARTVVISGYYGAKNTGDNLLLEAIAQSLMTDPAVNIEVAATNPAEVERAHGFQSFSRKDLAVALPELDACSAFVLGGGGLWNDYNYNELGGTLALFDHPKASVPGWTQTQLLARILGAAVHGYGLGVGPLTDGGARELVRFAAQSMDSLVVRDSQSQRLLADLGVDSSVAPDPVYGLTLPEPAAAPLPGRYVALNLRTWNYADEQHRVSLRDALTQWCREHESAVVGVPMQPSDVKDLQAFLDQLPTDIPRVNLRWQHDPAAALGALAHADLVVAMRLHACLLAHRLRRPVVGLCYDPKVSMHFAELHRSEYALGLDADGNSIQSAMRTATAGLPTKAVERIATIEQAASEGLHELARRIAAAPVKQIPADRRYPPASEPEPESGAGAERKGFLARMRG